MITHGKNRLPSLTEIDDGGNVFDVELPDTTAGGRGRSNSGTAGSGPSNPYALLEHLKDYTTSDVLHWLPLLIFRIVSLVLFLGLWIASAILMMQRFLTSMTNVALVFGSLYFSVAFALHCARLVVDHLYIHKKHRFNELRLVIVLRTFMRFLLPLAFTSTMFSSVFYWVIDFGSVLTSTSTSSSPSSSPSSASSEELVLVVINIIGHGVTPLVFVAEALMNTLTVYWKDFISVLALHAFYAGFVFLYYILTGEWAYAALDPRQNSLSWLVGVGSIVVVLLAFLLLRVAIVVREKANEAYRQWRERRALDKLRSRTVIIANDDDIDAI